MHYFTRGFLELAAESVRTNGVYHIAKKNIPSKDGPVQVLAPRMVLDLICGICQSRGLPASTGVETDLQADAFHLGTH